MADLSRRDFVKAAVIGGASATLGLGALSGVVPILGGGTAAPPPQPIVRPGPAGDLEPVRVADLAGDPVVAWTAQWAGLPTTVYKVRRTALEAASSVRGYNAGQYALQHPTEPDNVVLALGAVCTHLGCTVGFNKGLGGSRDVADYDGDGLPDGRILCPCHQAQFDVFDLGAHLAGTPAPRPLDAMAIRFGPELGGSPTLEGVERIRQQRARQADRQGAGAPFGLAG